MACHPSRRAAALACIRAWKVVKHTHLLLARVGACFMLCPTPSGSPCLPLNIALIVERLCTPGVWNMMEHHSAGVVIHFVVQHGNAGHGAWAGLCDAYVRGYSTPWLRLRPGGEHWGVERLLKAECSAVTAEPERPFHPLPA